MKFITLEHKGVIGLAYQWVMACEKGCCAADGIEIKAIINDHPTTLFIQAEDGEAIPELLETDAKGKPNSTIQAAFEHLVDEISNEQHNDNAGSPALPLTLLH